MDPLSAHTRLDERPVIYTGRFIDQVANTDLPKGYEILGEIDSPLQLAAIMDEASVLVLLDLHTFPFGTLAENQWDVPLVVALPSGPDTDSLVADFGETLFERLGFFDYIVTSNPTLWWDLSDRYGWVKSQHIEVEAGDFEGLVAELCTSFETGAATLNAVGEVGHGATRQRANRGSRQNLRQRKTVHRAQARTLEPRFGAAREGKSDDVPLDVLEVGASDGRWATSFDLSKTRFSGVDLDEDMIKAARRNFPSQRFGRLGPDLRLPHDYENFDLVFGVDVLQHETPAARMKLLSEMWRVTRPGGRLLFLESFVFEKPAERSVPPMPVSGFVDLVLETTDNRVVLEHVESLRYPDDNSFREGVISLLRL